MAHSEGTVVSFLGLLHALAGRQLTASSDPKKGTEVEDTGAPLPWLEKVEGYLTIGSPLDKHLLVWPTIFQDFNLDISKTLFEQRKPIRWRNYYDYGDPVGFKLETIRKWLFEIKKCRAFEFTEENDIGFARYLLPGKAHNDYWDDPDVFEHYVREVIQGESQAPKPKTRPLVYFVSPLLPYLISFVLLVAGTFLFYRAFTAYVHPEFDPLQRYIRVTQIGIIDTEAAVSGPRLFLNAIGVAALIAGATAIARLPRLATGKRWYVLGFLAYGVGALLYWKLVYAPSRADIGAAFSTFGEDAPTRGVLILGLIVGLLGLLAKIQPHETKDSDIVARKQRWILKGMRPLILCGALGILLLVAAQIRPVWFGKRLQFTPEQMATLQPGAERRTRAGEAFPRRHPESARDAGEL